MNHMPSNYSNKVSPRSKYSECHQCVCFAIWMRRGWDKMNTWMYTFWQNMDYVVQELPKKKKTIGGDLNGHVGKERQGSEKVNGG